MSHPPTTRKFLDLVPAVAGISPPRLVAVLLVAFAVAAAADRSAWARCGSIAHLNTVDVQRLTGYGEDQLLLMPKVYVVYDGGLVSFSFRPVSLPPCRGPECGSRERPADAGAAVASGVEGGVDVGLTPRAAAGYDGRAVRRLRAADLGSLLSGHLSLPLRPPIGG